MKLLFCTRCTDVVRLLGGPARACRCGAVAGRYVDEKRAEVEEREPGAAVVLGVDNAAFEAAFRRWQGQDAGQAQLFFLPRAATTVRRVKRRANGRALVERRRLEGPA